MRKDIAFDAEGVVLRGWHSLPGGPFDASTKDSRAASAAAWFVRHLGA